MVLRENRTYQIVIPVLCAIRIVQENNEIRL